MDTSARLESGSVAVGMTRTEPDHSQDVVSQTSFYVSEGHSCHLPGQGEGFGALKCDHADLCHPFTLCIVFCLVTLDNKTAITSNIMKTSTHNTYNLEIDYSYYERSM